MILVTGASGLVGSHVLYQLVLNGNICLAIYRNEQRKDSIYKLFEYYNPDLAATLWENVKWVKGDLSQPSFMEALFENSFDYVFHCAAKVSFFKADYPICLKQNRKVTAAIVDYCLLKNVKKLGYVSSTAAIGLAKSGMTSEKDLFVHDPSNSGYAVSKYGAEKEVWRGIEEGLSAVMINPSLIFGPGNWNESSLSIFKTVENGLRFFPTGSNAIVDVRDVANTLISLVFSSIENERFLCVGHNISFLEWFSKIAERMNKKAPSVQVPKWVSLIFGTFNEWKCRLTGEKKGLTVESVHSSYKTISYDNSKIKTALNHTFYTLEDTIENTIAGRLG
ncbi:MAG: hypothetical protein RL264_2626 [Bacteroidota bacterium]|jgi:nucleoside-diphosphate-sugar epimerase